MSNTAEEKLVDQLVEQIQRKIAAGEYVPGQKLKQVELANTFQVSRTPIRHALSLLAARGFVDQEHHSGVTVKAQSAKDVRDMYRVRAEVEGLAAQLAAHWIPDGQLVELRKIHERFVHAVSDLNRLRGSGATPDVSEEYEAARKEWVSTNSEFHKIIYNASGNAYLQKLISELQLGSSRGLIASSALGMYKHRMEKNITHHEAILAALEARDDLKARQAMATHVLESGEFVAAWIENQVRTRP
jgi:DNA-binding GntR family transcriptional regulator